VPHGLDVRAGAGYDGQFYYRLALQPWNLARSAHGITFDYALRRQRIMYSWLTWILSGGQAVAVPSVLVGVNIVMLGLMGLFSGRWAQTLGRHALWGLLPAGYFGMVWTLDRDLTEITAITLVVAGIVDNILNGLARPTFGWVSDHIGRENTMAIVFTFGAAAYWGLGTIGTTPYMFVITAGLVYFTWGEIYSLFPATCTDTYGSKYAATNAGMLYTAKGTAAFLVPAASYAQALTGSWHGVFVVATIANLIVAASALFILKPMRKAQIAYGDSGAMRRAPAE